jgi:hypothetical protein
VQCASSLITKSATIQAPAGSKAAQVTITSPVQQKTLPSQPRVQEPTVEGTEDVERTTRVQLWYQRLLHFRANPNTLEFSYLVLANPSATKYHPYDLIVVSHEQLVARKTSFFYTMSADGVTQTHGKEVTHMNLDEFERGCVSFRSRVHRTESFAVFLCWFCCLPACTGAADKEARLSFPKL